MNRRHLKGSGSERLHRLLCAALQAQLADAYDHQKRRGPLLYLLQASGLEQLAQQLRQIFVASAVKPGSMGLVVA